MANKIQIKRGLKSKLPTLNVGEPALCTDTKEVFIGTGTIEGNVQLAKQSDIEIIANDRGYVVTKDLGTLSNLNSVVLNGKYATITTILGYTGSYIVNVSNINTNFLVQKATLIAGDTTKRGRTFTRYLDDGGWSEWREIPTVDNISNPNLLINGDFQIWQRGTSFNVNSTQIVYTADRWCVNTDVSALVTKDTSGGLKVTSNSVGTFTNVIQKLEDDFVSKIIGKKVTLTVEFESGIELINVIGFTDILNTNNIFSYVKNGNKMSFTFTPTVVNKNYLYVQMLPNISNQGRSFVVKSVKLELGEIATPLSPRPYGEELALCQRYYIAKAAGRMTQYGANDMYFLIPIPARMRTSPTINSFYIGTILNGVAQAGFNVNTIDTSYNTSIAFIATKMAHGLTDGLLIINGLDAEIY